MDFVCEEYRKLFIESKRINKAIELLGQKTADEVCSFKIGQIVEICGYGYVGKKGKITKIQGYFNIKTIEWDYTNTECKRANLEEKDYKVTFHWCVRGNIIKKDGSIGEREFNFDNDIYEMFLKEKQNPVDMEKPQNKIMEVKS